MSRIAFVNIVTFCVTALFTLGIYGEERITVTDNFLPATNFSSVAQVAAYINSRPFQNNSIISIAFQSGNYSGLNNTQVSFGTDIAYRLQISIDFGTTGNVTVDCKGRWGWEFRNFFTVEISSTHDTFRFENCAAGTFGGALTFFNTSVNLHNIYFNKNSGVGSALFASNAAVTLGSEIYFMNNEGVAAYFHNMNQNKTISLNIFGGYADQVVTFQGNHQNLQCVGVENPARTVVQFIKANIANCECCESCTLVSSGVQIACTCDLPVGTTGTSGQSPTDPDNRALAIGLSVALALVAIGVGLSVAVFLYRRKKRLPDQLDLPEVPPNTFSEFKSPISLEKVWAIDYDEIVLTDALGEGAFGKVYKATWRSQEVAVKQISEKEGTTSQQQIGEFLAEANLMMKLRPHRNCLQIYGICNNPSKPLAIVSEYMPTGSLRSLLDTDKFISEQQLVQMAVDIACGCLHLHCENITHCDLAARNMLLDEYWRVKVADYGLARLNQGLNDGNVQFSLRWAAPEVINKAQFSQASDVWSFGVILYELWSRRTPYYVIINPKEVGRLVSQHSLALEIPMGMPPKIADIMSRCLQPDPSERRRFEDILLDLRECATPEAQQNLDVEIDSVRREYGLYRQVSSGHAVDAIDEKYIKAEDQYIRV